MKVSKIDITITEEDGHDTVFRIIDTPEGDMTKEEIIKWLSDLLQESKEGK